MRYIGLNMPSNSFSNPLFAILIYGTAILVAWLVLRLLPASISAVNNDGSTRYEAIDGLRGFLALGVFIHHSVITWFYLKTKVWTAPPSAFYNELGRGSVALFFMITAFLFWGKLIDQGSKIEWRRLYIGRIFRLYPIYLFMFAVVLALVFAVNDWSLRESPWTLMKKSISWLCFGIPSLPDLNQVVDTNLMNAGVIWSLKYEWLFYFALPVFGLVFARTRKPWAAVVATLAIVLIFVRYRGANSFETNILMAFLGGIVAAYCARFRSLRSILCTWPATLFALIALLGCIAFIHQPFAFIPILLLTIFFVTVAAGNTIFGLLKWKPLKWLGTISYSTYLLHGLVLWVGIQHVLSKFPKVPYVIACMAACVFLIVFNSTTYLLIEKPGLALGSSFQRRWRLIRGPAQK
jgi:peptidoglycan/LPS O-acetylase OafA/YrhL